MIALTACNPVKDLQHRESMTKLRAVVNTYRKLMRWGHFDQAAQYIKARDGSEMLPDLEEMSRYKVTGFSIAEQIVSETEFDAKVTAYVEFYEIDTLVTSSVRDEQLWWYDEIEKRWYLGSPMVDFSKFAR